MHRNVLHQPNKLLFSLFFSFLFRYDKLKYVIRVNYPFSEPFLVLKACLRPLACDP